MFDGFSKDKSRQQTRGDKPGDPTNINNQNSFIVSEAGIKGNQNKLDLSMAEQSEMEND